MHLATENVFKLSLHLFNLLHLFFFAFILVVFLDCHCVSYINMLIVKIIPKLCKPIDYSCQIKLNLMFLLQQNLS